MADTIQLIINLSVPVILLVCACVLFLIRPRIEHNSHVNGGYLLSSDTEKKVMLHKNEENFLGKKEFAPIVSDERIRQSFIAIQYFDESTDSANDVGWWVWRIGSKKQKICVSVRKKDDNYADTFIPLTFEGCAIRIEGYDDIIIELGASGTMESKTIKLRFHEEATV